jgi:phosphate transport system ATP-binding protein
MSMSNLKVEAKDFNLYYGDYQALKNIEFQAEECTITAFIGPSGCGKSTLLRSFNRMNDLIDGVRTEGVTLVNGISVYDKSVNVDELRKQVGMVFQKPNPFPKTIFENVAYGLHVDGMRDKHLIEERVVNSLQQAALWDEVKDKLKKSALALSGGQQQRLCIARALAIEPSILLMDEPASALDPISTAKIEELIYDLRNRYTIIIVTHNMQQAARVSDRTAFFYLGELIEMDDTKTIFTNPKSLQTQNYITGRFG